MMDAQQFEEVLREVLAERDNEPRGGDRFVMPIRPFRAIDADDVEVDVVGITATQEDSQNFEFIVILDRDGEIYPTVKNTVWRKGAQA